MASSPKRKKIDLLVLLIVLFVGTVAVSNARTLGDWWHFASYKPPANIQKLAEDAGMNDAGKRLFYRFSPTIVDKAGMQAACGPRLGCSEGQHIYILESTNQREYDRNIVTAAHEMLHVAWSRMSSSDKATIADEMKQQLERSSARQTNTEILIYKTQDYLEDYTNEAFAYTGSEVGDVTTALESRYAEFFSDRGKSVAAYQQSPEDTE